MAVYSYNSNKEGNMNLEFEGGHTKDFEGSGWCSCVTCVKVSINNRTWVKSIFKIKEDIRKCHYCTPNVIY